MVVLLAYALLALWVIKIGREAAIDSHHGVRGRGRHALVQVAVNIGMVTGLLPVVGVTLPLLSYGGSSASQSCWALGLVMKLSVRRFAY